jgi:hypothetical protein
MKKKGDKCGQQDTGCKKRMYGYPKLATLKTSYEGLSMLHKPSIHVTVDAKGLCIPLVPRTSF